MRKILFVSLFLFGLLLVSAPVLAGNHPTAHSSAQTPTVQQSPVESALQQARAFVNQILKSFQFQLGAHIGIVPVHPVIDHPQSNDTPVKSSTGDKRKPWQEDVFYDTGGAGAEK